MKKTTRLIGVVAIALVLTIAFSEVAFASRNVPSTPETETLTITTEIVCDRKVIESAELNWESSSENLDDTLQSGEKQGQIKYSGNMIASGGETEFENDFTVDTVKTPNLEVTKSIGFTAGESGSLRHDEVVDMSLISTRSYGYVAAESSRTVIEVLATTETNAQITSAPRLYYEIDAEGAGDATAGLHAFVEEGRYKKPVSRLKIDDMSSASGSFDFHKSIYCNP